MKTKNIRHHHKLRQIKKRQQDLLYTPCWNDFEPMHEVIKTKGFKMRITTPTLCSCWLCGNPRKFYKNSKLGKTLQELKAINDDCFGHLDCLIGELDDHIA
ncbi:MAG: hypothetical protein Q4B81_06675 [Moraxella sp.]|nr:hypothetical protein [Moraxella sp.]